jgi:putative Holliday junction resolvase
MPEAHAAVGMPPSTPPQTLLGFDFGTQRIGVAVGQRVIGTASALITLSAQDGQPDWTEVARLIETWQPDALVVGLPLALDGAHTEVTRAAERFARRLHGRFHLPVHMHDERLSSHAAENWGGTGARQDLDAQAARIILQDWLDGHGD